MTKSSSRIPRFFEKKIEERLHILKNFSDLNSDDLILLKQTLVQGDAHLYASMIENTVSVMPVPLGIATNFVINGKDYLIPMAIEEPSVIAGASFAAKLARSLGGFTSSCSSSIMIGIIQLVGVSDNEAAIQAIDSHKSELIVFAHAKDPVLIQQGGGIRDFSYHTYQTDRGDMLVVRIHVDVQDAMGANIVNTFAEAVASRITDLVKVRSCLRIVSNLAMQRMCRSLAVWPTHDLGQDIVDGILDAVALARVDPYRCVTHNKGIMNGIDAVALATGNDFRALEAGAHGYAAFSGSYQPLTKFYQNGGGDLVGEIELPLAVGTVGGAVKSNPVAQLALKILGVQSASELACVMAAVGLAQNFAALRALVGEGIQRGHMRLHSKNIAIQAGVPFSLVDEIAQQMIGENAISVGRALELWKDKQ